MLQDIHDTELPKFENDFPVKQGCMARFEHVHTWREYMSVKYSSLKREVPGIRGIVLGCHGSSCSQSTYKQLIIGLANG